MKITDRDANLVMEAMSSYGRPPSPLRLVHRSRQGVTRTALNTISKKIKRPVGVLAEILPSSYSTLTKKEVFDKATSGHILLIDQIFTYGIEVFGDLDRFNQWLDIPVGSFSGATPFSLLDTSFGIDLVKEELHKLDYGLPV